LIIAEGAQTFDNNINLAVCIFPPELCTSESLAEYMIEYTRFYANRFIWISSKIDIVDSKSIDDGMLQYGEKYDHILFMAAGVRIYDSSIIVDVGKVARDNPKYLAAAHILDWNDKNMWYELHHQFVLINTKNWRSIDKPHFGMWSNPFFDQDPWKEGSIDAYDPTKKIQTVHTTVPDNKADKIDIHVNTPPIASFKEPVEGLDHEVVMEPKVEKIDNERHLYNLIWTQHERHFTKVSYKYWVNCMAHATKDKTLPVIERSEENFHDHYTPLWIKDTGKRETIPDGLYLSPGHNIIDAAFQNDMEIVNWDQNIRNKRTYYYPEEKSEEIWYSLKDKVISDKIVNHNQKQLLDMAVNGIGDQIWLLNSEYMHIENAKEQYDKIILPCSGFKFLDCWKSEAFTDKGKLILYDYNLPSIQWLQHLHKSTLTDIEQLVIDYPSWKKLVWFNSRGQPILQKTDKGVKITSAEFWRGWSNTQHFFGGEEKFWNYIKQFREMDVQFEQIDLIQDPNKLYKIIDKDKTLLHISNIFSTDYIIAAHGLTKAQQYFDRFYSNLDNNTTCIGHSPSGEWKGNYRHRFFN